MVIGDYITFKSYKELVKSVSDNRDELLIRLLWDTGARISEVLNIRVKDVYDGKIRIYNLKRGYDDPIHKGNTRITHPSEESYALVRKWIEVRGLEPLATLFTIQRQTAWKIVTSKCEKHNITTVLEKTPSPKTFRHSRAIHMVNKGVPIARVGKYLGHKSIDTTFQYYLDYADSDRVKAENLKEGG